MKFENLNQEIEILEDEITIKTKKQENYTLDDLKQKVIRTLYESKCLDTNKEEIELLKIILENEKD